MESRSNTLVWASLTLSVVSLFVAISGVATAGKDAPAKLPANSVGSKQLKNDAVTSRDIAPEAVDADALGRFAVQSENLGRGVVDQGAIGTGAVGTEQIADDAVSSEDIGPEAVAARNMGPNSVPPLAMVPVTAVGTTAQTVTMDQSQFGCFYKDPVAFAGTDFDEGGFFSPAQPTRLTAPIAGRYTLTVSGEWPATAGVTKRGFYLRKILGSGPNAGQQVSIKSAGGPPSPDGSLNQGLVADFTLAAGDYIELQAITCGANSVVNNVDVNFRWAGKVR